MWCAYLTTHKLLFTCILYTSILIYFDTSSLVLQISAMFTVTVIIILMFCLEVGVSESKEYLIRGDLINTQLFKKSAATKNWTTYIDALLLDIPNTKNLEETYDQIYADVTLAKHCCSIPDSTLGTYQNIPRNTKTTVRSNATIWLPCGVIVYQYYFDPSVRFKDVYNLQVNEQFYLDVSIIEKQMRDLYFR